jgi:hypothetical protein
LYGGPSIQMEVRLAEVPQRRNQLAGSDEHCANKQEEKNHEAPDEFLQSSPRHHQGAGGG